MKTSYWRRSAVALIAAVACLGLMAAPASAVSANYEITGGTLTFSGGTVVSLAPVPGSPCAPGTLTADTTATTANVTALNATGIRDIGGTDYLVVLSRLGSTAGTVSGNTVSNLRVTVGAAIYTAPASGCTVTGTPLCRLAVQLNLNGTHSDPAAPSTGDTATLSGGSLAPHVVANPTCTAGPSFLVGQSLTVSNLTAVVL